MRSSLTTTVEHEGKDYIVRLELVNVGTVHEFGATTEAAYEAVAVEAPDGSLVKLSEFPEDLLIKAELDAQDSGTDDDEWREEEL